MKIGSLFPYPLYLLCINSCPQYKRGKILDPQCSQPKKWRQRRIYSPEKSFSLKYHRRSSYMLVVTGEQVTQGTVPSCSPELAVVIDLAELGALVGAGGVGVEDAVLCNLAGAQGDALTGVLLTQTPSNEKLHVLTLDS